MPQLHYLRERVTSVRRMAKGKVHVPEDLQLPDDVIQVLELGPKFGLQSERTNPELLTVVRQVARRATEGEEERITSEEVDAISRCKPDQMDSTTLAAKSTPPFRPPDCPNLGALSPVSDLQSFLSQRQWSYRSARKTLIAINASVADSVEGRRRGCLETQDDLENWSTLEAGT
ncbi:hypothetical protein HPB51_026594 [Rhipicephalus microplus]|uniref:Uncharacterized protein n=1 Tax=Rhipicephalus microplus TaxID=6941 RepID=A0A9J6D283_RHIMP|nr:hypothetical protein HPB51_026594 [Rhipicephalus microplus]